jgi:hypothetical protein
VKITRAQQDQLLAELGVGHDLPSAAVTAGIPLEVIRADTELLAACGEAFSLGTSRVRSRLLQKALTAGDCYVLERALQQRERAQAEFARSVAPEPTGDGGYSDRLAQLSDRELELVEWLWTGEGDRPGPEVVYLSVPVARDWPRDWSPPLAPAPRDLDGAALDDALEVSDPAEPLPPGRSLAVSPSASPTPPARQGGLPKALADRSSPWFADGLNGSI